jgi:predicted ABC-type ATPase
MLTKMRKMTDQRRSFAFETTLSGRSYATWISGLQSTGYQFHLVFLWLPYDDLAVQRVKDRVRKGGHSIPEDAIRRRYQLGLENFFQIYSPIAKSWRMYDNSTRKPRLVALGSGLTIMEVYDPNLWKEIYEKFKA